MPRGSFTAARHLSVSDAFLTAGTGFVDFLTLRAIQAPSFVPQAILCNSSSDAGEQTAGYAMIRGYLFGENEEYVDTYRIPIGIPTGLAFKCIYASGTTARGIKMLSEC